MTLIQFTGAALPEAAMFSELYAHGYRVVLEPHSPRAAHTRSVQQPSVVVLALQDEPEITRFGHQVHQQAIPWLGWNTSDAPALARAAYAAGARAVLPSVLPVSVLIQALQLACSASPPPCSRVHRQDIPRTYRRGTPIHFPTEYTLDVVAGVVAQTMLHRDGCEVLMGLSGPGQLLLGHPEDACCLQLRAHSDATVVVRPWEDAVGTPHFAERLRDRVRLMEGWSAMQARPHLDQRIVGILSVLAEQFGVPHARGVVLDVRITHAQLAAAVGATRSTVTRLLANLRMRGDLSTIGAGENERYCLCRWEPTDHMQPLHARHVAAD